MTRRLFIAASVILASTLCGCIGFPIANDSTIHTTEGRDVDASAAFEAVMQFNDQVEQ